MFEKKILLLKDIKNKYPTNDSTIGKLSYNNEYKQHYQNIVNKFNNPTILDFGGGNCVNYNMLSDLKQHKYIIVELKDFKTNNNNIIFTNSIYNIKDQIDIFYSNSGIQYVLDIVDLINYICEILKPKYILIHRIHFTENESYLTKQENINVLYWIFNLEEFVNMLPNYKYEILQTSEYMAYEEMVGAHKEKIKYISLLFTRIEK